MPFYTYRARNQRGALVTGEMEMMGEAQVEDILDKRGLIPVTIKKKTQTFKLPSKVENFFKPKVRAEEILVLTRQFHTLFKAGMSMETLLNTLATQTKHALLRT